MSNKQFTILSIEDNKADFELLKTALNNPPSPTLNIINILNGESALDFMNKKGEYKEAPTPHIIILDIKLPFMSGKEVLKALKKDKKHKIIPVIIFSTNNHYKEIEEIYELYANSYITKTSNIKELFEKIGTLKQYWFETNVLPSSNNFYFIDKNKKIGEKYENINNRR